MLDAIDERTLLVPLSHVLFKTAELSDLEPVVARAHEAGAHVFLDAYQSVGAVPLDVTALGVDFATGGSVKWLCGGPGAAWLYVRPDLAERLEPALTGWQAHEQPFAFEPEQRYAEGAQRFLTGTPNVPALYAATAGYDVIEELGVDPIRANSLRLTKLLIGLLDEAGLEVTSQREPAQRGGTVCVRTPDSRPCTGSSPSGRSCATSAPTSACGSARTTSRPRTSSRFAVDQIAEIVETGAYERHLGAAARF